MIHVIKRLPLGHLVTCSQEQLVDSHASSYNSLALITLEHVQLSLPFRRSGTFECARALEDGTTELDYLVDVFLQRQGLIHSHS